jgi:hypothetical protein
VRGNGILPPVTRRILHTLIAAAIIATVAFAPAVLVFAEEEGAGGDDTTVTTVGFEPGTEPAVVLSDAAPAEDDAAWTFRYLVPSLLVLSGLAIAGLFIWYGLGVKGRYRVAR